MVAALAAGLCLLQGDLGSAIVLAGIVFAVAFVAGHPLTPMAVRRRPPVWAVSVLFVMSSQRRLDRFTAFLDVAGNRDHLATRRTRR